MKDNQSLFFNLLVVYITDLAVQASHVKNSNMTINVDFDCIYYSNKRERKSFGNSKFIYLLLTKKWPTLLAKKLSTYKWTLTREIAIHKLTWWYYLKIGLLYYQERLSSGDLDFVFAVHSKKFSSPGQQDWRVHREYYTLHESTLELA